MKIAKALDMNILVYTRTPRADEDGDHDFGIMGDVDLDATQDGGEVIFKNYRVGFIEDLLED